MTGEETAVEALMPTPQKKTLQLGQLQPGLPPGKSASQEPPPPFAAELARSENIPSI